MIARPDDAVTGRSLVLMTAASTLVAVFAVMPAFLAGAAGVLISDDLRADIPMIGLAVGAFFTASAVTSPFGGHLADRAGPTRSLLRVSLASPLVLLAAALAPTFPVLVLALCCGGVVNGLAQPAAALALADSGHGRQAFLFGIKQSGIPIATLFAGAAVPLVGLHFGWRWTFAVGAALAMGSLCLVTTLPASETLATHRSRRALDLSAAAMLCLIIAMGVGTAAATAIGVYLVPTAVRSGASVDTAGWLLVCGSLAGVAARLLSGWIADRRGGNGLGTTGVMLLAGTLGYATFAIEDSRWLLVATVVAYAFGWGWTGLMNFSVVHLNPTSPATAAGLLQLGGAAGAAVGPILFGQILDRTSYPTAWLTAAAGLLASAVLVLALRAQLATVLEHRTRSSFGPTIDYTD